MPTNMAIWGIIIIAALVIILLMLIVDDLSVRKKAKKNSIGTLYIQGDDIYCEFNRELDEIKKMDKAVIQIRKV